MSVDGNMLVALSENMVRAVEKAGDVTVCVEARGRSGASGILFGPDTVLTANHVVEREDDIRVGFPDGNQENARIAGRDPASDLCVLRLDHSRGNPQALSVNEARVGVFVLSLGRPDMNGIQASMGVVGAVGGPLRLGRAGMLERYIRTDAIPYPGFSGGPLVDGEGEILGINTSGFIPGVSLAIPSAIAQRILESLLKHGHIRRGYLGVRSQAVELSPDLATELGRHQVSGLILVGIEHGQPAEKAGLIVGDILVGMQGLPVEHHDDLLEQLAGDLAGTTVDIEILRGGKLIHRRVVIGEAN